MDIKQTHDYSCKSTYTIRCLSIKPQPPVLTTPTHPTPFWLTADMLIPPLHMNANTVTRHGIIGNGGASALTVSTQNTAAKTSRIIHYSDVMMRVMASQITSVSIVCWNVCLGADERKHQSSACKGMDSPHKGPVTRKRFSFDDVIMGHCICTRSDLGIFPLSGDNTALAWCLNDCP